MENLKYIIESLLFVSDMPIMLKQIHYIMPDVKMSDIRKAVEELTHEYNEREGSFYLSNVAGGIQLRTRSVYKEWIKRFIRSRPIRLSRAALEALAIVAYKQPVTRAEVDKIRGVDSGAIMRSLVENKLIRNIGRKEVAGRPMLYTTSRRFLEVFDLNDLKDLPAPDDLEINDEDQAKLAEKFNLQPDNQSSDMPQDANETSQENEQGEALSDSVQDTPEEIQEVEQDIVDTGQDITNDSQDISNTGQDVTEDFQENKQDISDTGQDITEDPLEIDQDEDLL
ncbi:MAG: SMC-Scp complex subunit ScpB [Candidatus Magnetomorum sp.]|nr:SMC-Scp complex subunit ScpB [Candidatus Magnetomorum sp.]